LTGDKAQVRRSSSGRGSGWSHFLTIDGKLRQH
jgi:hypothetical protein